MRIASRRRMRRMVRVAPVRFVCRTARDEERMDAAVLWTRRARPQGLGKPHSTRFPTAPTRSIDLGRNEETEARRPMTLTRLTHEIPDTPIRGNAGPSINSHLIIPIIQFNYPITRLPDYQITRFPRF